MSKYNSIMSLKGGIEKEVRAYFEAQISEAYEKLRAEYNLKWDAEINKARKQAKGMANSMTLELLQKVNFSGISVEFKI